MKVWDPVATIKKRRLEPAKRAPRVAYVHACGVRLRSVSEAYVHLRECQHSGGRDAA